jgi:ferrous-iron efflux pump FieF
LVELILVTETSSEWVGIATMTIAIGVSAALVAKLRRVARETDSPALSSDAAHYVTDIYINIGVLVALAVTLLTGWRLADPLISIAIGLYILISAAGIGHESIEILMDKRLPAEIDEIIASIVGRYRDQGVVGLPIYRLELTVPCGPGPCAFFN